MTGVNLAGGSQARGAAGLRGEVEGAPLDEQRLARVVAVEVVLVWKGGAGRTHA